MNKKPIILVSRNKHQIVIIDSGDDESINYRDIPATDEKFWQGAVIHVPEMPKQI